MTDRLYTWHALVWQDGILLDLWLQTPLRKADAVTHMASRCVPGEGVGVLYLGRHRTQLDPAENGDAMDRLKALGDVAGTFQIGSGLVGGGSIAWQEGA